MNNRPGWFSVWKIIALVIAVGTLVYRIVCNVIYLDEISEYWGSILPVYLSVYAVFILTGVTSFTRGKLTLIFSIVTAVLSGLMLCYDGLMAVVYMADSHIYTFTEMGYLPLCSFLLLLASCFNFIGFFSIRSRDRKKIAG